MTTSTKPYLVRALYDWCVDNGFTPHLAVWVNEHTQVPRQFVQDEQIILNISPNACKGLLIDNEWVNFEARFGGKAEDIWVPIGHIMGIFARENNEGMGFDIEPYEVAAPLSADSVQADESESLPKSPEAVVTSSSGFLKIVK